MKTVVIAFCLTILVPWAVYLVAKYATFGYFNGREMWKRTSRFEKTDNKDQ